MKAAARNLWRRLFGRPAGGPAVAPGLYHYLRPGAGAPLRCHLRVEPDGRGLLLVNAAVAARLSPSGALLARELLAGTPEGEIAGLAGRHFRGATAAAVAGDLARLRRVLEGLAAPGAAWPLVNLADDGYEPEAGRLIAPLRADVPLAPRELLAPLLEKLWAAAIPQAVFIAGENPDPEALVAAVERAEDLGLISGVRARASDLAAPGLVERLARAGVDHVTLLYAAAPAAVHDELAGAGDHAAAEQLFGELRRREVCPAAQVPLVAATAGLLEETSARLVELGVENASFFALAAPEGEDPAGALAARELPPLAAAVEELGAAGGLRCSWEPPVRRLPGASLPALARAGPRCAGDAGVRVEPDGTVLPARGPRTGAGNLRRDSWAEIWGHEVFRRYRELVETPSRCPDCPGLVLCAAACPRDPRGWAE